jgi:hypothetical protein
MRTLKSEMVRLVRASNAPGPLAEAFCWLLYRGGDLTKRRRRNRGHGKSWTGRQRVFRGGAYVPRGDARREAS